MDVQNPGAVEIPNLKLVVAGKSRERKRGGVAALGGAGAKVGVSAGLSLAKTLVMLAVVGGVSTGAWQVGKMLNGGSTSGAQAPVKKVFADNGPQHYDDVSGVIKSAASIPNSTGYVSGSADGLTPEERAKKAADEEAARKAEEDAAKKAQAEADKQAQAQAQTPTLPAQPEAPAGGAKKGLAGGKFGKLGSSFGSSGLNGGSGLAGGISRGFGGVSGLGSHVLKGQSGTLSKGGKGGGPAGFTSASHATAARGRSSSASKNQLFGLASLSRQAAKNGRTEGASATLAKGFDNAIDPGTAIDGGGGGASIAATGQTDTKANPGDPGGPIGGAKTCEELGTCAATPPPATKKFKYQYLVDGVKDMMITVGVLAMGIMWEKHVLKGEMAAAVVDYEAVMATMAHIKMLLLAVAALGIAICALGLTLMALTHDLITTGIVAIIGAVIATYAIISLPDLTGGVDFLQASDMAAAATIPAASGVMVAAAGQFAATDIKPKINMD